MIQFRQLEHAITEDGEWGTIEGFPLDYRGRRLCDSCHAEVVIEEDRSGNEIFVHSRHNRIERVKNQNCQYAKWSKASNIARSSLHLMDSFY